MTDMEKAESSRYIDCIARFLVAAHYGWAGDSGASERKWAREKALQAASRLGGPAYSWYRRGIERASDMLKKELPFG